MEKTYDPKTTEEKIYQMWESMDAFSSEGSAKLREKSGLVSTGKPFSVLMPPPNANAPLHCGHATYALQDLMIRFKRMQGYDAMYLPGTDHAGFETQVVYERNLKKEGKSRFDFDRETFFKNVYDFVQENSQTAINQLKRIGMSADWARSTFTLDPQVIDFVYDTFLKMAKDGMVYRDGYMVNYSTFYGTTFSDLELDYKDSISPLYYVKYARVDDSAKYITVATVRPETIYADVAIAVNPADTRFKDFVGKKVINPLNGREVPVIEDEYVEMDFGTGALKITPGHDMNDYKIGKKHSLEVVSLINLDGRMNENAGEVAGMFPKEARLKTAEILQSKGAIEKIDEKYANRLLVDYKDGFPIEPMILPNWFINMDKLSEMAIDAVETEKVKFNLPEWKRDILYWIKEKKPWPISRQTVFGIRIPVWYSVKENPDLMVNFIDTKGGRVSGKISDLLQKHELSEIKQGLQRIFAEVGSKFEVSKASPGEDYLQETDTFDTWFSSGQWPLVTTKAKDEKLFEKYYPTDLLDSGYDIMFFWIARMIMFGLYLTGEVPFKNVYFHGMVTDKNGIKMSKSKGNVVNPMEIVEKYGADALRMGLMVGGNTEARLSPFDEDKVRGYRNFANKIWNVGRFIKTEIEKESKVFHFDEATIPTMANGPDKDFCMEYLAVVEKVTKYLDEYQFKFAGEEIYHFIWDRLANKYLEETKLKTYSLGMLRYVFLGSLKLLHPFMPYITEAVWTEIPKQEGYPIIISNWPKA